MYSDKVLVIDIEACAIYDKDKYPSEYWGIYKTKCEDEIVYYIYNKCTLCIVYYFIPYKPIVNVKNTPELDSYYSNPMFGSSYPIPMDDIAHSGNRYTFTLYARNIKGYVLIYVDYCTETETLTEEYKGTTSYYPHGIQIYKNNIPKLDAQGKLKLTLGNTCAFTRLEHRVIREGVCLW